MKLVYCNLYTNTCFKLLLLNLFISCQLWSMYPDYDFNNGDWDLFGQGTSDNYNLDSPATPVAPNNQANALLLPTRTSAPMSMEFEGQGHAISERPMVLEDVNREDVDKNLDNIARRYHIKVTEIQEIKNLKLPLSEVNNFITSLERKTPREANKLWNELFRSKETALAALKYNSTPDAKRKADNELDDAPGNKRSKPRVGADKDAPLIIGLDDFLKIGKAKGLNLDLVTSFFNALVKSKIIESFDMFKDLNPIEALRYIQQRPGTQNQSFDLDQRFNFGGQKNELFLSELKDYLNSKKIDIPDTGFLGDLARVLLSRANTDILSIPWLIDIAGFLTGIYRSYLENDEKFTRAFVKEICISLADQKTPHEHLKFLYKYYFQDVDGKNFEPGQQMINFLRSGPSIFGSTSQLVSVLNEMLKNDIYNANPKNQKKSHEENLLENRINKGLINNGSNCYLNAVLQVLSQISGLSSNIDEALMSNEYPTDLRTQKALHNILSQIFKSMKGETKMFNPSNISDYFRSFLRINGDALYDDGQGRQQDAQEAYSAIFNKVVEKKDNIAKDFEILFEYHDTMSDETRRAIEEEALRQNIINPDEKLVVTIQRSEVSTMLNLEVENKTFTDLNSCIDKYLQEETIETNYWSTNTGKEISLLKLLGKGKSVQRIKKIKQLPKILVIYLNRFHNQKNYLKKIDNNILFPIKMDAGSYFRSDGNLPAYDLRGTIFHGGPSIHAGHYWAFVKNLVTKQYFSYNDETRTFISDNDMESIGNFGENIQIKSQSDGIRGNAYMLFYELIE